MMEPDEIRVVARLAAEAAIASGDLGYQRLLVKIFGDLAEYRVELLKVKADTENWNMVQRNSPIL